MSDFSERNFIVGIFGENKELNNRIGQAIGSPGTKSDIQFYNRLDSELNQVFCALTPLDYPEKIKPLLQSLTLTNIHLLIVDLNIGLNATIGELIVAIDLFHQLYNTEVLIIVDGINSKTEWKLSEVRKKITQLTETTSFKNAELFEIKTKEDFHLLKQKIIKLGIKLAEQEPTGSNITKILIDHAFPVKGIGTVILGIVKEGKVTAGQMLELSGYDGPSKKVIVRSIQKHDRDFKEAYQGDRVGLALKGNIAPNEISRDNFLISHGSYKPETEIKARVSLNEYFKPKDKYIKPGNGIQFNALVDVKLSPFKFIKGDDLYPGKTAEATLKFDKLLYHTGNGLRGIIADLNKFENKLRIVGSFSQISY
ncbi:MAG: EF-Tu/IF-2/RF-3 family GTPase [Candidatus Hermodarchaeota archaeon]